ncbi:MAG TPA: hypothetical protein VF055_09480 [Steroidobacteraceae bacterium]|jgi:hypothetical protein
MKNWFSRVVLRRRWATFVVLGVAFFVFGVGTLSLFMLLQANLNLLADHGWQAVRDGGAWQLAELLVTGYLALMAYLVFEVCKTSLVRGWLDDDPGPT